MRFKQFLAEMPYITEPLPTPSGGTTTPFDTALEDNNIYSRAKVKKITMDILKRTGKFPLYSEKENTVFIHDTKTNTSYYAKDKDEREMIEILLNSMWRHSLGRGKDAQKSVDLKKIGGVDWKLPKFVYSTRNISK